MRYNIGQRVRLNVRYDNANPGDEGIVIVASDRPESDGLVTIRLDKDKRPITCFNHRVSLIHGSNVSCPHNKENNNVKFKFLEIAKDGEPKAGDYLHCAPFEITGFPNTIGHVPSYVVNNRLFSTYVRKDDSLYYYATSVQGTSYTYHKDGVTILRFPGEALVSMFHIHNRIITVEPNTEAKKAISAILKTLKPRGNVLISQVMLDDSVGFKGLSIYCDNKRVALYHDQRLLNIELEENGEYANNILAMFGKLELTNKKDYSLCVERAFSEAGKAGEDQLKMCIANVDGQIKPIAKHLKDTAKEYVAFKTGMSKIKCINIPELAGVLKEVENTIKYKIAETDTQKKAYALHMKKHIELKEMSAHVKRAKKKVGADYALVKKLIKNGLIDKIEYAKGVLIWEYAPLTYKLGNNVTDREVFLGVVRIEISDRDGAIAIKMPSYPNGSNVGTLHLLKCTDGKQYCLGSFKEPLYREIACRNVANIILLMREYLKSYYSSSPYVDGGRRNWDLMDINNPQVVDDSFKRYLLIKTKKEIKETTNA